MLRGQSILLELQPVRLGLQSMPLALQLLDARRFDLLALTRSA